MLVYEYFEGDEAELAWQQHAVYDQAISLIIRSVIGQIHRLGTIPHATGGETPSVDHRTLQVAHDLLAAAWRHQRIQARSGIGPFEGWLDWLKVELWRWGDSPAALNAAHEIIANQNSEAGYAAEDRLREWLLARFADLNLYLDSAKRRQW